MTLKLSSHEQRLLTKASETMLSPGTFPDETDWHNAVMIDLLRLTGACKSAIRVAEPRGFRMTPMGFEDSAIEEHKSYYYRFDFGRALGDKPILGQVFSRNEYYGSNLPRLRKTEYYADYITKYKAFDALCISSRGHEHQKGIVLYLWYDREMDVSRRRNRLAMLRLLAPSFRAGLTIGTRVQRHPENPVGTFEECSDGCALFNLDGVLLHRNPALSVILASEESNDELSRAIIESANAIRDSHVRRSSVAETLTRVSTVLRLASKSYAISACVLEYGSSNAASILVTVSPKGGDAARQYDFGKVRDAFRLTEREVEVVILLSKRQRNHEVANRLGVSEHTARHHTENVMRKLGVATRSEVAGVIAGFCRANQ
jgi:DNA-binding CsgD family transcriptional regulator